MMPDFRTKSFFLLLFFIFAGIIALAHAKASDLSDLQTSQKSTDQQSTKNSISSKTSQLPVEAFARLPFVTDATISPNGKYLAGLFGIKGQQVIGIIGLDKAEEQEKTRIFVGLPDETETNWLRWVGNDNLVVGVNKLLRVETDRWYISRMFAINRESQKVTRLLPKIGGQNGDDLLWAPADDGVEIIASAQNSIYSGEDFWPTVYRINVETGRFQRMDRGRQGVLKWLSDSSGVVRMGIAYNDSSGTQTLLYRQRDGQSFKAIERAKLRQDEDLTLPFLILPGSDEGLVIRDDESGKSVVQRINLVTQENVATEFELPNGEIRSAILSKDRSRLLGVRTNDGANPIFWIDEQLKSVQKALNSSVNNAKVRITSIDNNLNRMIVRIGTADNPGLIYLFERSSGTFVRLAAINEKIGNKRMSRAKYVQYDARDGLEIEAVLTLPKGRKAEDLPLIAMPHGGPWAHDTLSYDYWAQFLADRGYAVLQPNFRGSTGYGDSFVKKGLGQMGFAMQDDITDGVNWLVEQGIADPQRVCIVGASYGGYAAMWGIAKDPDFYCCAISISGVSNLRREVNDFGGNVYSKTYKSQWKKMTPDFRAVSPIYAVDRIKAPLLLIHGRKDVTVDHKQSVIMEKAMKKAGKSVEFVSLPKADHYFTREPDRLMLLQHMEAFLAKHNPAD